MFLIFSYSHCLMKKRTGNGKKLPYLKNVTFIVMAVSGFCAPTVAIAGQQTGKLTYASADQVFANGVVTLRVIGEPSGKPACATSSGDDRWTINVANGKIANQYIFSLAMTAMAAGWRVTVTGTGSCTVVSYLEDVAYIEVAK